ncbi:signal peptide peptidase SppA [Heliobacterium chlorum]|uniref:Signal peptide peptidase SppA n=1 Tax=Heliobacterium chlorum TaxID=2698 RepID=A0ABR7T193_HELCL|nr:signal peptide peptidase SppA [Heliobacterium chlorum]MBC9784547.1 signal peptide peptidase SppA [Heliobacterium chlorum]
MAKAKNWVIGTIVGLVILSLLVVVIRVGSHRPEGGLKTGAGANRVAVVRLEGTIMDSGSSGGLLGGTGGSADLLETLREIQEDKELKAVVLRINSPGGTSAASQEIGQEIQRVRESGKVVVTSMGDVAASGGYWIAAKSDKIVANPATTTGSIGVIMDLANLKELYDKIGYRPEVIKSGPHKDIASSSREMTPEERQILQTMVNDIYDQFVDVVAEGRKLPKETVRTLADGRVYTGRQAKDLGLVDELGNFYDAVQLAATMAGMQEKPEIVEYGRRSPLDEILGMESRWKGASQSGTRSGLSAEDVLRLMELLKGKQPLP